VGAIQPKDLRELPQKTLESELVSIKKGISMEKTI
jgi:hypothetical protein